MVKFSVERRLINEALGPLGRVAAVKTSIPILECVCLSADNNKLSLYAYNTEIGMRRVINAGVYSPGETAISARLLGDVIRKADGETAEITVDGATARIECGKSVFEIPAADAGEFPKPPVSDEGAQSVKLPATGLRDMIQKTVFCVAGEDTSRPVLRGELFEITPAGLTVVGLDGFRVAIRRANVETGVKKSVVIPGKLLTEITRLIRDDDETIEAVLSENSVCFKSGEYEITSRLMEGEYLNYKNAIPTEFSTSVVVTPREVAEIVDRVSLLINEQLKIPVRCRVGEGRMTFSCASSMGRGTDFYECEPAGEDLEIGFNSRFFTDILKAIDEDTAVIRFNGALSPIVLTPTEGDAFCYLLMPMRLPTANNA